MPLLKKAGIYTHTNISSPEPETNHCPGNGLNHMCIIECPNDHKISPSIEFWSSHKLVTQLVTQQIVDSYLPNLTQEKFDTKQNGLIMILS